jgi:phosphoribosylformylglycinamidine synthase
VATGADPARIALLDNFCWGDPQRPETLGALVAAAWGCHDAALRYGTPFISGKDSLNNEYLGSDGLRHAIPPTLLISALGLIDDVGQAVTTDAKTAGDVIYLLGAEQGALGSSHLGLLGLPEYRAVAEAEDVPGPADWAPALYRALHAAIRGGHVRACHDLSEGGLAVAAAEMCIGGRLGMALTLPGGEPLRALFGETNGTLLAEVQPDAAAEFEHLLIGHPVRRLGAVTKAPYLEIHVQGVTLSLPVDALAAAWNNSRP